VYNDCVLMGFLHCTMHTFNYQYYHNYRQYNTIVTIQYKDLYGDDSKIYRPAMPYSTIKYTRENKEKTYRNDRNRNVSTPIDRLID